ncbi:MAG TPA: cupin domain-containing protein [Methanocella sp.]|nr:cupin domain-containing protein [Methanocella sp.]
MHFFDLKNMQYKLKRKGVQVKAITGERCQMLRIRLDPGFESDHCHSEEQIGLVLAGKIVLTVDGVTKSCVEGDAYHIPSNARHSFKVLSSGPAEIIDFFSPPKEENRL